MSSAANHLSFTEESGYIPAAMSRVKGSSTEKSEYVMSDMLVFNDVQFDVLDRDGQPWIKASQLAQALGYADEGLVSRLYRRNADEFTENMTQVIEIGEEDHFGNAGRFRIFSLRGCHLLSMFSRTPVAKSFRVWVLDVLENLNRGELARTALPPADAPITPDQQCTLQNMVRAMVDKGGIYAAIWSRFNNHFRLAKYSQLPQSRMGEAITYLMHFDVAPKALPAPKPQPSPLQRMALDYIPRLRRLAYEFSQTSDELFGIFARDDEVVQSLHLAAQLTNQSLVRHYSDIAGRV